MSKSVAECEDMKDTLRVAINALKNNEKSLDRAVKVWSSTAKKVLNNKDLCSKARNKTLVKMANQYLNLLADSKYASKPKVIKKKKIIKKVVKANAEPVKPKPKKKKIIKKVVKVDKPKPKPRKKKIVKKKKCTC